MNHEPSLSGCRRHLFLRSLRRCLRAPTREARAEAIPLLVSLGDKRGDKAGCTRVRRSNVRTLPCLWPTLSSVPVGSRSSSWAGSGSKEWRKKATDFSVFVNDGMLGTGGSDKWRCFIALALEQQERQRQFIQPGEGEACLCRTFATPGILSGTVKVPARLSEVAEHLYCHGVHVEKTP